MCSSSLRTVALAGSVLALGGCALPPGERGTELSPYELPPYGGCTRTTVEGVPGLEPDTTERVVFDDRERWVEWTRAAGSTARSERRTLDDVGWALVDEVEDTRSHAYGAPDWEAERWTFEVDDRGFWTGGVREVRDADAPEWVRDATLGAYVEGEEGLAVYEAYEVTPVVGDPTVERWTSSWVDGWLVDRYGWSGQELREESHSVRDESGRLLEFREGVSPDTWVDVYERDEHGRVVATELFHASEPERLRQRATWEWSDTCHGVVAATLDEDGDGAIDATGTGECQGPWPLSTRFAWTWDDGEAYAYEADWTCGAGA